MGRRNEEEYDEGKTEEWEKWSWRVEYHKLWTQEGNRGQGREKGKHWKMRTGYRQEKQRQPHWDKQKGTSREEVG